MKELSEDQNLSEVYLGPYQTILMGLLAKIFNGLHGFL